MGGGYSSRWYRREPADLLEEAEIEEEAEKDKPKNKKSPDKEKSNDEKLAAAYQAMRVATHQLEELIENGIGFSEKDLHRLDKAVVIQKAGYKAVKRILAKRGYSGLKRAAFRQMLNVQELNKRID